MKLLSAIITFFPLLSLAIARPIEPPIATEREPSGIRTRGIDLCSPKCKAQLEFWQTCIYLPYCHDSREFNNRQTSYDNCCKVAVPTKPQPENKPNEAIERINSILEYLGLNPVGKPVGA